MEFDRIVREREMKVVEKADLRGREQSTDCGCGSSALMRMPALPTTQQRAVL